MTVDVSRPPFRDAFAFELGHADEVQQVAMAVVADDDVEARSVLLHGDERALLPAPRYTTRRGALIRGREAAKSALRLLRPETEPAHIAILPGEKGRPVVTGAGVDGIGVSLSHIRGASIAIAFPDTCPIGIDWERIASANATALKRVSSPRELTEYGDDLVTLTRLWALKEALAKSVGTGFSAPIETFETAILTQTDDDFRATFKAFPQHAGDGVSSPHLCLALVTKAAVIASPAMAHVGRWLELLSRGCPDTTGIGWNER